jgi:serine/threonine-protein kinase
MSTPAAVELAAGSVVGSYRIVSELGRGGMGIVYEASHVVLARRAALKVMHAELRRQPGMASRIVQEASILEEVRHPGVARVFECNLLPDHRPWIAMELVEGETLAARLARLVALEPSELATVLTDVADVLASVHACGIVHRDLKPDNVILTPRDRDFPLRVIDWSVARLGPLGRLTLDGMTPGTPVYMSPEQAAGRDISAACDIYSLGVIAYEALAGQPPFDGRTLAEVVCMHLSGEPVPLRERCAAPQALCALVHRMLHKQPQARPSALEVRQVARAVATDASCYESFELTGGDAHGRPTHVDPDLEFGVTELLPAIRRPRWTPEVAASWSSLVNEPPEMRRRR